jgi:hypothetical protein
MDGKRWRGVKRGSDPYKRIKSLHACKLQEFLLSSINISGINLKNFPCPVLRISM